MDSSTSSPLVAPPSPRPPKGEQPLLPPLLLGPSSFLWLWVVPVSVLLLLNLQGFRLIEGNMDAAQRTAALWLGAAGLANFLIGAALCGTIFRLAKSRSPEVLQHPGWAGAAIVVQVAYLWFALASMDQVLPRSVTAWMYPEEHFMFNQFAFAMLPLFLGILRLAALGTFRAFGKSVAVNLLMAIAGPVLLFVLFHGVRMLDGFGHITGIFLISAGIVCGIMMFVGLGRAILMLLRRTRDWGATGERVAILVFALALPLAGLALNRSIPFPVDLQAWEVYALVLVNTAFLLLTSYQHAQRPLLTFNLLCGTLPFSLYFFIVFLPYTPLSVLAVIAMGAGFLVLTPILLFILHLHLLKEAWFSPLLGEKRGRVLASGVACFLLLPGFFTVRGLADKAALNAALDYVYTPALKTGDTIYPANRLNLARALRNHRSYKNGIFYPLLSGYYSWLVFDNLVLPDDKLARLETVFFGKAGLVESSDPFRSSNHGWGRTNRDRNRMPRPALLPRTVEVSQLDLRTRSLDAHTQQVTLALTLKNTGSGPAEYVKALPLPPGIFVSGFRLQVNGTLVPGKIVEKKTALWVYTMIRDSERRDPGLLYYNTPTELELRVFPVVTTAPSVIELDVLVPSAGTAAPLLPNSSDPAVVLARLGQSFPAQIAESASGAYFAGGGETPSFPSVAGQAYFHLMIDRSQDHGYAGDFAASLRQLQERFPNVRQARVSLINYNVIDPVAELTALDKLPRYRPGELDQLLPLSGGFAADLALAHALRQHGERELNHAAPDAPPLRPIFVFLSRTAAPSTLDLALTHAWSDEVPGLEIESLGADGTFVAQSPVEPAALPLLRWGDVVRPVLPDRPVYFPSGATGQTVSFWSPARSRWETLSSVVHPAPASAWSRAAALHLQHQDYARSPGDAPIGLKALVQASRESGILLPATSYIVVENAVQWRMLDISERKKLEQNAALSFRETPAPPALWLALGFGAWIVFRHVQRKRRRAAHLEVAA